MNDIKDDELKAYIEDVISSIMDAVASLQSKYCTGSDTTTPIIGNPPPSSGSGMANLGTGNVPTDKVHFEVALNTVAQKDSGGKIGLKIAVFSGETGSRGTTEQGMTQKVTFDIPVTYPAVCRNGQKNTPNITIV